jgi:hypothetical protein
MLIISDLSKPTSFPKGPPDDHPVLQLSHRHLHRSCPPTPVARSLNPEIKDEYHDHETLPAVLLGRKDWRAAFSGLRALLADANDTAQVFRIMQALNAGSAKAGYERLLRTGSGGRIAWEHVELAEKLADPAFIACFADGTVGAVYRAFLAETGYTATGLADVSR